MPSSFTPYSAFQMQPTAPTPANALVAHRRPRQQLVDNLLKAVIHPSTPPNQIEAIGTNLISQVPTDSSPAAAKSLLQYVLLQTIILLLRPGSADSAAETSSFQAALRVIDVALYLKDHSHIEDHVPGEVLRYFFSLCTLSQLSASISHILPRLLHYGRSTRRKPDIICTTIALMQRDTEGWDPVLMGRLNLLLAASKPVWHPSGMNRRGNYHDQIRLDFETQAKENTLSNVDMDLYEQFWSLQNHVRSPQLAENPQRWAMISNGMHKVLEVFETLVCIPNHQQDDCDAGSAYLISPAILRLQMVDPKFRRRILLQYAIFLGHMETVAETVLKGNEHVDFQKKVEFCRTLFANGGDGAKLKNKVHVQLDRDSGGRFKRFASLQMQRDRIWLQWRRLGYKNLTDKVVQAPKIFKRRATLSPVPDVVDGSQAGKKRRMEISEQGAWQDKKDPWQTLTKNERIAPLMESDRSPVPTLQELQSELKEDVEEKDITDDLKRKNDPKFVWRSLRVLCDQSVSTLIKVIDLKAKGGIDLEHCLSGVDVKQENDCDPAGK